MGVCRKQGKGREKKKKKKLWFVWQINEKINKTPINGSSCVGEYGAR